MAEQDDDEPTVGNAPEAPASLPPPVPAATLIPEQPLAPKTDEPCKEPKFGLEVKDTKGPYELLGCFRRKCSSRQRNARLVSRLSM